MAEMKMADTMNAPPILGPTRLRMVPKKFMTEARPEHHEKRLFIHVHAFEILEFPVRVRHAMVNEVYEAGAG
jgi:hypothetical protein